LKPGGAKQGLWLNPEPEIARVGARHKRHSGLVIEILVDLLLNE
jgi:hypothetical protein